MASPQCELLHDSLRLLLGQNTCHTVCIHKAFLQYELVHESLGVLLD